MKAICDKVKVAAYASRYFRNDNEIDLRNRFEF